MTARSRFIRGWIVGIMIAAALGGFVRLITHNGVLGFIVGVVMSLLICSFLAWQLLRLYR